MMTAEIVAILANTVLRSASSFVPGMEIISALGTKLVESVTDAREEYESKPKDITSPFEQKRSTQLTQLGALHTEVVLQVTNQNLLLRLLPLLVEQTIQCYKAQTDQDLKLVELSAAQVRGVLAQHRRMKQQRWWARTLAIVVSFLAIGGLGFLIYWGTFQDGPRVNTILPVLELPLPVLLWSAIGSFTAILYRFNSSGDVELQDPLRWLFTRPLTGIVIGTIAYFVVKIGLVSIAGESSDVTTSAVGTAEILWLVAFIAGFSDRFGDNILRTLVGRFGGDSQQDLVSINDAAISPDIPSLSSLLEGLRNLSDRNKPHLDEKIKADVQSERPISPAETPAQLGASITNPPSQSSMQELVTVERDSTRTHDSTSTNSKS